MLLIRRKKKMHLILFLCKSEFSCCDSYEDSWMFIKQGKNSLERYSNLGLCFLST